MKAIILAAGKGTRLLPLTKDTPQPLLKIKGKTILEKQIEYIKKAGITDVLVLTGYLSEKIEEFCKNKVKTQFNPFYTVSNTALTLWIAKHELKQGFILLYSDILFDYRILEGLLKSDKDICLAIKKNGIRSEAEKVREEDGMIKHLTKSDTAEENGEFIGMAKFSKTGAIKVIAELDEIAKKDLNATFINVIDGMLKKGHAVHAFDIGDVEFIDIDFPEDLTRAKKIKI